VVNVMEEQGPAGITTTWIVGWELGQFEHKTRRNAESAEPLIPFIRVTTLSNGQGRLCNSIINGRDDPTVVNNCMSAHLTESGALQHARVDG